MKIAITISVYNESRFIGQLLDRFSAQTRKPDQIVIVDDGSQDGTGDIVRQRAKQDPSIKYIYQENAGIAVARNKAWKNSEADICVFTDGDCVPDLQWLEELVRPFADNGVGATAGTYRTMNRENILARFIGLEIEWKYRSVSGEIDAHGTYNLAVRKSVLDELGGFNEQFNVSGEDWDLTHRIAQRYKLIFVPQAVVGHYHPEELWPYLRNQAQRGKDRVRLYREHPDIARGDTYTPGYIKYQVGLAGLLFPSWVLFYPWFTGSALIPAAVAGALLGTLCIPLPYYLRKDLPVALWSIPVQLVRSLAWFVGLLGALLQRRG